MPGPGRVAAVAGPRSSGRSSSSSSSSEPKKNCATRTAAQIPIGTIGQKNGSPSPSEAAETAVTTQMPVRMTAVPAHDRHSVRCSRRASAFSTSAVSARTDGRAVRSTAGRSATSRSRSARTVAA